MRKTLAILMIAMTVLSLWACASNPTEPNKPTIATTIPTTVPTTAPTTVPTTAPTTVPTTAPTTVPTTAPTTVPTTAPTTVPTTAPTTVPTTAPTTVPTTAPTTVPTTAPTTVPTTAPTTVPTTAPTTAPTTKPTTVPTHTHVYRDATCTAPKTCSCGATTGSAKGHSYANGTCSECGVKDPDCSEITYILNISTKKFHRPSCSRLPTENRQDTTLSREEIVAQGYKSCGYCKP